MTKLDLIRARAAAWKDQFNDVEDPVLLSVLIDRQYLLDLVEQLTNTLRDISDLGHGGPDQEAVSDMDMVTDMADYGLDLLSEEETIV